MYARCGAISKGKEVFEELPFRDVVMWNALIAGYAQCEHYDGALTCFQQMQCEGLFPNDVTYSCILKACGGLGVIDKGRVAHIEIVQQGILQDNVVLGGALVGMYAKCSEFVEAKQIFQCLSNRNVVCWSALIEGYANGQHGKKALDCFQQMLDEGFSPNGVTFISVLKACGSIKALDQGQAIHFQIVRQGLLCGDTTLGGALVDMYIRCGAFAHANKVFDVLSVRNVFLWNIMISGYVQGDNGKVALNYFEWMQHEGLLPDAVTFASVLKCYGGIGVLSKGEDLHCEIVRQGLLGEDIVLANALVDMYAKCGAYEKAKEVIQGGMSRNVTLWNALIAGYVLGGFEKNALDCFVLMQCEGLSPDEVTFVSILKACAGLGALDMGEVLHSQIVKQGLLGRHSVLGNALVDMYVKCGALKRAKKVFEKLPIQDVISWNAYMAGYEQSEYDKEALECLERMQYEGVIPDAVTFICVLKVCGKLGDLEQGKILHTDILRQELLDRHFVLGNALLDMYMKCGALARGTQVFHELPNRDIVSWSTIITGCVEMEYNKEALEYFELMLCEGISPNSVTSICLLKACGCIRALENGQNIHLGIVSELSGENAILSGALVDMYAKCGVLATAKEILEELILCDVVQWNVLIAGYIQEGYEIDALNCFEKLESKGVSSSAITFICILKACGNIGALIKGEILHCDIVKRGLLGRHATLGNALVDMYGKCGALVQAKQVLEELPCRDVVSWNALIMGYAQREYGKEAIHCFEQMQHEGILADDVTFLCVLSACSHSFLWNEGGKYLAEMITEYDITPDLEHFTCLINLLGCIGFLDRAVTVILGSSNDLPMWLTLLNACRKWGNVKLGVWAFEHIVNLDTMSASSYAHVGCHWYNVEKVKLGGECKSNFDSVCATFLQETKHQHR